MASDFPAYVAYGHEHSTVEDYTPGAAASEPSLPGDLVTYDTTDKTMDLCGTDPSSIAGISEVDSAAATGAQTTAGTTIAALTPDGKCPFRLIRSAGVVLALSSTTTPAETHVGNTYGVTRSATKHWQLDTAKTGGSARVKVERVDITNGIFFCSVLSTDLQFAAT